jgi:WD40 repeat protein
MKRLTQAIAAFAFTIFTQGIFPRPILAQTAAYVELQEYKQLCFTNPVTCQQIAQAAEIAMKTVYDSAEMNNQLASCPSFYESCQGVKVQIIDYTLSNQQILSNLIRTIETTEAENQLKFQINISNFFNAFNDLGGYAMVFQQQTVQGNGRPKVSYLITFKGTIPSQINDLFTNAYVRPTSLSEQHPDILVHSGFRQYAKTVAIATETILKEMLNAQADPNLDVEILLAGHSLGGAAATIYGMLLQDQGILAENMQIITFAAPPFIREESMDLFAQTYGNLPIIAIENRGDLILDTPLFKNGYEAKGYQFPPIRQLIQGNLSRSLENLYKQREIMQPRDYSMTRDERSTNSQQLALESKIKAEQTNIHVNSYHQYYQYYLEILAGDREFNRRLNGTVSPAFSGAMAPTNPDVFKPMATNITPNYTLTDTLNNPGRGIGINPLAITPDGQILVSGHQDGSLTFWHLKNREKIAELAAHERTVTALAISGDGQTLVSSSKNGSFKVLHLSDRQEKYQINVDAYPINALAISPNSQYLVTGHGNGKLRIWNLANGEELRTITAHSQWINSLTFSPNGQIIASGTGNEPIKFWQTETGEAIANHRRHLGQVWGIFPGIEEELLVISSFERTIKIWHLYSGEEIRTFADKSGTIWTVATPNYYHQTLSQENQPFLLYTGSWDGQIKVWSFSTGGAIFSVSGDSRPVTSLLLSPDGQTLISSSWDGQIRIWQQN